jgi:hypothetical protein
MILNNFLIYIVVDGTVGIKSVYLLKKNIILKKERKNNKI